MQNLKPFTLGLKRPGWPQIILIVAVLSLVYSAILVIVRGDFPDYYDWAQTLGHIVITVGAILVIRLWEQRIIDDDHEATVKSMQEDRAATAELMRREREAVTSLMLREREATDALVKGRFDELVGIHFPLAINATEMGLKAIYPTRQKAMAEVTKAIEHASSKLWLLGVAFKETFSIDGQINMITKRIRNHPKMDARFLLLNPLTTPAVIRSFLESDLKVVEEYLSTHHRDGGGGRGFVRSTLYTDIDQAFRQLNNDDFKGRVKFYRRDPSMWLVIVDNRVFMEPYTFGRPSEQREVGVHNRRMGGHMPVFEFDGTSSRLLKNL